MNKIIRASAGLFIITILAKILGFIRETVLVSNYGASMTTDAYITAMNIPNILFAVIASALATTLIPIFFQVEKERGEEKSLEFLNNIISIVIIATIILAILGYIFAQPLTHIFAIQFSGEKLAMATNFTKTMIFGMIFIALSNIMISFLQIKGNFIIPGMMAIPYNIIVILIILFSNNNVEILAIGTFIAMISQFLFQFVFAIKNGFKYRFYINVKDEYIKKMLPLILPVFLAVGVRQINIIVDRSLASTLGDGMITVLNSANKLNEFALGLFISTIAVVIYPFIAKLSIDGDKESLITIVKKSINTIIILITPVSIGAIVLAEPIVRIIYERGSFTPSATNLTASALAFYSIGMIGSGVTTILNQVFYAFKDTNKPMKIASLSVVINIILAITLIKYIGHIGLAFATSIASILGSIILFVNLKNKIGDFGQLDIIRTALKSLVASVVMGVLVSIVYKYTISSINIESLSILISVVSGCVVYGILIIAFKVDEVRWLLSNIKIKINKKSKIETN
ncbi:murein biosynthesis integral membrane protein MurJ [Romboutsia sp.]|uniref:murein biosynthesis integral membrane protein MurJ n=1 Tax=Romboutsia sp. TaxID=1965302 RepID=UPI003F3A04EB